jgi:two-component system nitrogen regulation response regulator NtrX
LKNTPDHYGVLVVEDDSAIRRLVKSVLGREGYRVDMAVDGVEAVLKLGVSDFDVIVLDLMMPNLDGFAFIETMAIHDPERLRKVIVTSAASPAVIKARMRGNPFAVLLKPFNIEDLIERVRQCIEAQQAA